VAYRDRIVVFVCFAMQSEVSRVKRARMLSQNEIREIVMDSDSDEDTNYACEMDEEQPGSSSRRSFITQPASPEFLPTALKLRMTLAM
jgi:hypothetical protein